MRERERHNGKENPIGIETALMILKGAGNSGHNGKENPIGIETPAGNAIKRGDEVTMEKKTR